MRAWLDTIDQTAVIEPTETKMATELLAMALAARRGCECAGLRAEDQRVYRHILTQYPLAGRAPSSEAIVKALKLSSPEDVRTILGQLHELDLLCLDTAGREVLRAYPFSNLPTRHLVRFHAWPEAKPVYALCAVDALGVPFMVRRDVVIASACASCGRPIALDVKNRAIVARDPAETVVWVGTARSECAATSICPTINFFCSPGHVEAWRQGQPEAAGHVLSLGEALYLGRGIFEDVLQGKPAASAQRYADSTGC